jgi:hypothetical protein
MTIVVIVGVLVAIATLAWMAWGRHDDQTRTAAQMAATQASAERQMAEKLVRWLEGRRVLWNPMIKEIPEEAVKSVGTIRERVDGDFGDLRHPTARQALGTIRAACVELLDKPRESFRSNLSTQAEGALQTFRDQVHPAVEALANAYTLAPPMWPDFRGGFEGEGKRINVVPRSES